MKEEDFKEKKRSGKIFSFIEEFRGDFLTPIAIFSANKAKRKFIFESGTRGTNFARYSFIGGSDENITEFNSLEAVNKEIRRNFDESSNNLPFKGGVIGYTAYNLIGKYEKTLKYKNEDKIQVPDCLFTLVNDYICYDHFTHKVMIIKTIFENDKRTFEEIKSEIQKEYKKLCNFKFNILVENDDNFEEVKFESNFSKEEYIKKVEKCKEYI